MQKYRFYGKADSTQESIKTYTASSLIEAVEYFATLKDLSVEKFLKVYELEELD